MIKKFRQLKPWQKLLICVIPIGLLGAVIGPVKTTKTSPPQTTNCNMASIIAKEFVLENLKAPGSAKFPGNFSCTNGDSSTYAITSYVDSENSFGALLRNHYSIKLRYMGGVDADRRSWKVVSLTFSK